MVFVSVVSYVFFLPESLRLDESQSIWQANNTLKDLFELSARDIHLPLYNILLHFWMEIFGVNIFTNRILSLIFFLASTPMVYLVAFQVTKNVRLCLYAATIFSLSPFMHWFGNEQRMYSLFVFFSLCSHLFFLKIFTSPKTDFKNWIYYFIFSVLGIYSHYFFLLFILIQFVYFVINKKNYPQDYFVKVVSIGFGLVIAIIPWVLYVKHVNSAGSQIPFLLKPSTVDLFNVFSNHFFGFQSDEINSVILASWPLFGILCLYFLQKRDFRNSREIGKKFDLFSQDYFYFAVMAIMPTLLLFVISIFLRPIFLSRYLIMCIAPSYILISILFFSYRSKFLILLRVTFIFLIGISLFVQIGNPYSNVKENYSQAIEYVSSQSKRDDIIAVTAPFTIFPFKYYYQGETRITSIPEWDLTNSIPAFDEEVTLVQLSKLSQKYNNLYLVASYDQGYEKKLLDLVNTKAKLVESKSFPGKIKVLKYKTIK
jgi:mannosyltransferase